MIDQDIQKLADRDSTSLAGLEADIWRREVQYAARRKSARRLTGWQLAVMLVAVLFSASFGVSQAVTNHRSCGALFAAAELAPSNLILGGRP
jgi:hypothetical protein